MMNSFTEIKLPPVGRDDVAIVERTGSSDVQDVESAAEGDAGVSAGKRRGIPEDRWPIDLVAADPPATKVGIE
jgi:hypothetical protein